MADAEPVDWKLAFERADEQLKRAEKTLHLKITELELKNKECEALSNFLKTQLSEKEVEFDRTILVERNSRLKLGIGFSELLADLSRRAESMMSILENSDEVCLDRIESMKSEVKLLPNLLREFRNDHLQNESS